MTDNAGAAMKEFLERMKKLQDQTGKRIHYMGCGEYDFTQQAPGGAESVTPEPKEPDKPVEAENAESNVISNAGKNDSQLTQHDDHVHDHEKERMAELERGDYPGITSDVRYFEEAKLPECIHCGSSDTASVQIGIVGQTIAIAGRTRKFKLIPNGPRPGRYFCHACRKYFDSKEEEKS